MKSLRLKNITKPEPLGWHVLGSLEREYGLEQAPGTFKSVMECLEPLESGQKYGFVFALVLTKFEKFGVCS